MNMEEKEVKKSFKDTMASVAEKVGKTTTDIVSKTTEGVDKTKDAVFHAIDQNGDGEIGIDDVIIMGLKVPGIKINREAFLRKELFKRFPQEVINSKHFHQRTMAS